MRKLSEEEILKRDASRDLNAELINAVSDLKGGNVGRVMIAKPDGSLAESPVTRIRISMGLSQAEFAGLIGVSKRTVQQWEQRRREPSGAARSLLKIAEKRPDVLRETLCAI